MVQADEILLTELKPLFNPASVAAGLTALQQLGEHEILQRKDKREHLYSSETGCRSSRAQFMLSVLVSLRKRTAASTKTVIKKWCDATASRTAVEIQLRNEELKIKQQYHLNDDDDQNQNENRNNNNNTTSGSSSSSNNKAGPAVLLGIDVSSDDVIEIPCLLLLCAFSVTYLPGISSIKRQGELFSQAVKVAQSDGDLIVRDDISLDEVIEFGLDVAETPKWRWLSLKTHAATVFSVKVMALLWSLSLSSSASSTSSMSEQTQGSSSSYSAPSSVFADPHLLLWSSYSATSCPDAVIIESAEEARIILQEDDQQDQCEELWMMTNTENNSSNNSCFSVATGVVILLVADRREWTIDSLVSTCQGLLKQRKNLPFSIWIDSHECHDLMQALSRLGSFSMLQWVPVETTNENDDSDDYHHGEISLEFVESWLLQTMNCPSFPVQFLNNNNNNNHEGSNHNNSSGHSSSLAQQQNIVSAAISSLLAIEDASRSICSSELSEQLCTCCCRRNNNNTGECRLGVLSFIAARLPDIVPSYAQATLGGRVVSPQEKKLASRRAAAPSLPPGISMSPDVLFLYRLAEQIPSDFFSAFWVSLLLLTSSSSAAICSSSSLINRSSNWKPDTTIVKMSIHWSSSSGASSLSSSSSGDKAGKPTTTTTTSVLTSSTSMCKAFSFVLTSWCEEKLLLVNEQDLEEAVGRLKSVADVIDRHRTVNVRAFQQSVTASRAELRSIMDVYELLKSGVISEKQLIASSSLSSSTNQEDKINNNSDESQHQHSYFAVAEESYKSRHNLFESWQRTSSFAKRNYRAAMIVLQQVGQVFEREASQVVRKLMEGGRRGVQPMIVLRMRAELEKVASYYDVAMNTAIKALGVKGKCLLYVSDELQSNMKIIREAL